MFSQSVCEAVRGPGETAYPHPNEPSWRQLVLGATAVRRSPVVAQSFRRGLESFSRPRILKCDDGNDYFVKAPAVGGNPDYLRQLKRSLVNEQVVAHLGSLIGAPVPPARLVQIGEQMIAENPATLGHLRAGIAHGSLAVAGCTRDKEGIRYEDVEQNKPRFAALAILYGWTCAVDRQLIYPDLAPHLVWSVDHGHFFNGPMWSEASLNALGPRAPFAEFVSKCGLTSNDLRTAAFALTVLTPTDVAEAVSRPADEWGVSIDERAALACFLWRGASDILATVL